MRKHYNFIKKTGLILGFIFCKKNSRTMTCGNCKSTNIVPISNPLEQPFINNNIKADMYVQFSKCKKCGAVCKEIQLWNKNGNINELGCIESSE